MADPNKIDMDEVMRAEMKPDVYDGPNCDQVRPLWHVYADGDKDSDNIVEPIDLDPRLFPPGTEVVVSEPLCPDCGDRRPMKYPTPEKGPVFEDKCMCGFDWAKWTLDRYS